MSPDPRLLDALTAGANADALRRLDAAGVLTALLPGLEAGRGFEQPELHYFTVLDHCLAAADAMADVIGGGPAGVELAGAIPWIDLNGSLDRTIDGLPLAGLLRLAALLHDVGKPDSAAWIDGRLRFPRHGPLGAEIVRKELPRIGFGEEATAFVALMVRYHLRPGDLIRPAPATDRAMRKFVIDLDGHVLPLLLINLVDGMATQGPRYTRGHFERHCRFFNYVLARSMAAVDESEPSLVTGHDLLTDLGLQSGRLLGAVLESVRRAQAQGAITTREEALALARTTLASLERER